MSHLPSLNVRHPSDTDEEAPSSVIPDMECQNCMCMRWYDWRIPLVEEYAYFAVYEPEPLGPENLTATEAASKTYEKEYRPIRYALRCADCGHEQEFGKKAQEVHLIISRDPRHHWHWEMDRIHQMGLNQQAGKFDYSERQLTIEMDHEKWFFIHTRSDSWRGLKFTDYEIRDMDIDPRLRYELDARLGR